MIHKSKFLASLTALALGLGGLALAIPTPASAAQPDFICEPLDSGKIDTVGDPETVTVTAPAGYLIDGYCVKAGTTSYFIVVDPPAAQVIIDHPDKDSVSHYSLSYVAINVEPDVATATLDFSPASCDAAETPTLPGSSISNATWGADTNPDPLAYSIVATASPGAEFAPGAGVSDDGLTKTFSGTLDPVVDDASCDEDQADLATASLQFTNPSCLAPQLPNIGGSPISNATWGSDTNPDPLAYSIVATANPGAEFAPATGVSDDRLTKTFSGTLDPILPDEECLDTESLVLPAITFAQASCTEDGSYTVGAAPGYSASNLSFTVNGVSGVLPGTYTVTATQDVTITAQVALPDTLEPSWVNPPAFEFEAASDCVKISEVTPTGASTLAFTGGTASYLGWTLGGGVLFLGLALLLVRRTRATATEQ